MNIYANWRWLKVIFPFLSTVILLLLGVLYSMDVLSSMHAFTEAERSYSKAQKQAVLKLVEYAASHDERDYQQFLFWIAVPVGDRTARLALNTIPPNLSAARQGLLKGRNHEDDIEGLIRLYRNFSHITYIRKIIAIWEKGDEYIAELETVANRMHGEYVSRRFDPATQEARLVHIKQIDIHLNLLEEAFSFNSERGARDFQHIFMLVMLVITLILTVFVAFILRRKWLKTEKIANILRISEERLDLAMRGTSDGLWDWDIQAKSVYYSPRFKELIEQDGEKLLYTPNNFVQYIHPGDVDLARVAMNNYLRDSTSFDIEFRIVTRTGKLRWIRSRAQSALDSVGTPLRLAGSITDITERKMASLELLRTNRALQMLSRCSEAVNRTENEYDLLLQVCRTAVDVGGYLLAWVGFAQDDEARTITYAAMASDHGEIAPAEIKSNVSKDSCPALQAIHSGAPVIVSGRELDIQFLSCLSDLQRENCYGAICLPLRDKGSTFGVLVLYSGDALSVSNDETKLLQELADDLAFGIVSIRLQEEKRQIQTAVLNIAVGVSASNGTAFFEQLATNMTEALGGSAGFVARFLPGEPISMRTIAVVMDGLIINNFDCILEGSPGEKLITVDSFVVSEKAFMDFSHSPFLRVLNVQAYVGRRLFNSKGDPIGLLVVLFTEALKKANFITNTLQIFAARAASEMERQETDTRILDQASLLDKAQDAIIVSGINENILFWNKSAERLYGWTQEEALNSTINFLSDKPESFHAATKSVIELGEWSGEITKRRKDGSILTVESRWTLVRGDDGHPLSVLAIDTDITQRKAAEREIQHLAYYDPLTLLPNRALLIDRLHKALLLGCHVQHSGALLFIDLDNFKTINDTLGHSTGDLLLQQVAQRLASIASLNDTVARFGGDEFVVMLLELDTNPTQACIQVKIIAEKILSILSHPYEIAGLEHHSTSSIGITLFCDDRDPVSELLKRADLAMYEAKKGGRNAMRFFDPEMETALIVRAALEADLRQALRRDEFFVCYQPQINNNGQIIGAEALVRWQHPRLGIISPADFIPLAEETGLIMPLGKWVLETASAQLAAWASHMETSELTIAVNVSVRQFRHPDFVAQIKSVLHFRGANPRRLKLELTESLMVDNMEETIAKMIELKSEGITLSLDDFGTGYSSLTYLKRLPLDQLKIDRSFVKDVLIDPNDASIARTIIALGKSLGLEVVAEGVETDAQRSFLAQQGCDAYQGYYFSCPIQIKKLEAFIHDNLCIANVSDP
ncbi:bifunctional diguanylate cyclase/phosphodiesterase [Glaciimonas immobilis]|uniref:Diguanylate cyclase (GGDEF)-like protein/PAS domain S-box-containing protein n=1 Tax=Glaciimonas immobilis TaxID=728004 RepID=A0A840RNQ3_9BURK|nr:EAL domain-containing protein [Glaciimonas immobilis]KAF3997939.1 EAL domain-containing protein [Glaciimonas immobilis]MBB5199393.1 diguanylate cyclase (GGDEF)-like protein/PAS domain S-box-containing protein [Glaciimonas immobilis]